MSNKDAKTSKTAHVMNLLSRNRGGSESAAEAPPAETPAEREPAVQQPVETAAVSTGAPKAAAPPILASLKADAEVSSQIKDALEAELGEIEAKAPVTPPQPPVQPAQPVQPEPEPVKAEEPVPAPAPAPEPIPEPEPAPAPAPAPVVEAAAAPEKAPAAVEAPAAEAPAEPENTEEITYVNVMQVLVEEKADKYMEMFGICQCSKCKADVKAYALNRLAPKYVVMGQHEVIPKLTFYEMQNSSDIIAQIIKACKIVMNTPHHDR